MNCQVRVGCKATDAFLLYNCYPQIGTSRLPSQQINSQSLEDTQVGYISQKYILDKHTLEKIHNLHITSATLRITSAILRITSATLRITSAILHITSAILRIKKLRKVGKKLRKSWEKVGEKLRKVGTPQRKVSVPGVFEPFPYSLPQTKS